MRPLEDQFIALTRRYARQEALARELWAEISWAYGSSKRHYHTLAHLAAMRAELAPHQASVAEWDTLLFALFYHDAVYDVLRADNEERSAELASARLERLAVPPEQVARCRDQILATKRHEPGGDADTALLTDADLAVLGQPWPAYEQYAQQVRAEYGIYPDLLYRPGRRKVLRHFLAKDRIYQTAPFFAQYEAAARTNLARELSQR